MSVFVANPGQHAEQQPFSCPICQRGFTRRENLKRHAALHRSSAQAKQFPCGVCQTGFSRPDLRQRHVRKKHASGSRQSVSGTERDSHRSRRHSIEANSPESASDVNSPPDLLTLVDDLAFEPNLEAQGELQRTTAHDLTPEEQFDQSARNLSPKGSFSFTPGPNFDPVQESILSASQESYGYDIYWTHVSAFMPFIHRATFDSDQAPRSVSLSMLSLAYQYGEDPDRSFAFGSGMTLSAACFDTACRCIEDDFNRRNSESVQDLRLVQAMMMLEVLAILYFCDEKTSSKGFELHHRMVALMRKAVLTRSSEDIDQTEMPDLESLWYRFVQSETLKRTILMAHQIDALWYQSLSLPRLLSHLEIKCELAGPQELWAAPNAETWAYRRLLSGNQTSTPQLKYGDIVRQLLAPEVELAALTSLDHFGAISIAHFLLSSARESSGWAIMTGRVSLDRFEPLKSSLAMLEPLMSVVERTGNSSTSNACQALWHVAMIELQVWWPSHVLGTVAGSVDEFLKQSSSAMTSFQMCSGSETAQAIRPHIEWFLCYLDSNCEDPADPPWLVLYAYKAFLMAWRLLHQQQPDIMMVVGVDAGDSASALAWAKLAFQEKKPSKLVGLIDECMNSLGLPFP